MWEMNYSHLYLFYFYVETSLYQLTLSYSNKFALVYLVPLKDIMHCSNLSFLWIHIISYSWNLTYLFQETCSHIIMNYCFIVVLVWGSYRKIPQLGSLKQEEFILSQFWMLDVQNQGVGWAMLPLKASWPLLVSGGSWHTLAFFGL